VPLPALALAVALGLDGLLMAALWAGGPAGVTLGTLHVSPGWIDVLAPLFGMGAAALVLQHLGARATLARTLVAARVRLSSASPLRRAQLLAATCLTLAALNSALAAPIEALRLRVFQASRTYPSLTHNGDNAHLPALLGAVAARSNPDAVVVHLEDEDPRGHVAAYYAYPRLLLMAPARRAWSTRMRMDRLGVPDPVLPPTGPAPGLETSASFAAAQRAELLVLRGRDLLTAAEALP